MNIQFCSGGNTLPNFHNHDMDCDITKPIPYHDGVADFILCEHGLEHHASPVALRFLQECHRILKPGGILRVCCPAVGPWLGRPLAIDLLVSHGHCLLLTEDAMRTFLWAAGFEIENIRRTDRKVIDGHHSVIGIEKDNIETCRMEATR